MYKFVRRSSSAIKSEVLLFTVRCKALAKEFYTGSYRYTCIKGVTGETSVLVRIDFGARIIKVDIIETAQVSIHL